MYDKHGSDISQAATDKWSMDAATGKTIQCLRDVTEQFVEECSASPT